MQACLAINQTTYRAHIVDQAKATRNGAIVFKYTDCTVVMNWLTANPTIQSAVVDHTWGVIAPRAVTIQCTITITRYSYPLIDHHAVVSQGVVTLVASDGIGGAARYCCECRCGKAKPQGN